MSKYILMENKEESIILKRLDVRCLKQQNSDMRGKRRIDDGV